MLIVVPRWCSVCNTVALAVRALRQDHIGHQLHIDQRDDETAWLDADSGDIVSLDLGRPAGREAGYLHPAVVVTAQRILDAAPNVIQVVPLTSAVRTFHSEIVIEPDSANGLEQTSAAQCQHLRAVSPARVVRTLGNVGPLALSQIRETIAVIIDVP